MDQKSQPHPPRVLIFPFPVQSHVNSMLKLAELLCLAGIHVTFLNSDHNHRLLLRHSGAHARLAHYPGFQFATIPDGLPADHPRTGDRIKELFDALSAVMRPRFREMMVSSRLGSDTKGAVTCIIADGIMCFTIDVAEEVGIPIISFRTVSASCFWAFFCIPKLIEAGELPLRGDDDDMDRPASAVSGMESFLRIRDLPAFCRVHDLTDPGLQLVTTETQLTTRAHALILNTFDELEESALTHIRTHISKVYTIGPLHAHLATRQSAEPASSLPDMTRSNSLWEEDRSCMAWLDSQPIKSVIYVSFGSITVVTTDQMIEFWYGLVNSGKPFLWVIRPNSVAGERQIPTELSEATKKRGYMVGWVPQEEVLAHPSVGGFLTHSGWNSTLESIVSEKPMICWPYFADQQVNSRFVGEAVWRIGLDMKDTCDRLTVEKMVRDLLEVRRDEFLRSVHRMAELAKKSVREGGSSYRNLDRMIEDIKSMICHVH
ncbi:UDP-glucosyl transferase 72E1 [Actinidia rufa]|uniref:Glycosyltransferase n=1 Tax=Actinidia rufa TaxID=165716 RepID=A0A7J0EBB1_9ERIC|nr:UDP-glucosyl transferase 72E1 [Actinidia rufa]